MNQSYLAHKSTDIQDESEDENFLERPLRETLLFLFIISLILQSHFISKQTCSSTCFILVSAMRKACGRARHSDFKKSPEEPAGEAELPFLTHALPQGTLRALHQQPTAHASGPAQTLLWYDLQAKNGFYIFKWSPKKKKSKKYVLTEIIHCLSSPSLIPILYHVVKTCGGSKNFTLLAS